MCGIAGFFNNQNHLANYNKKIISEMTEALKKRGPDENGTFFNEKLTFGHTRLSIIELSKHGSQPKKSFSKRFVIVFNGEIYNHLELRQKLKNDGFQIQWNSNSDTETLVNLFEFWEIEKILNSISGMFAFAVWDNLKSELILSRDRFGEKPLYYGWIDKKFVFSSELKSIKKFPKFEKNISDTSANIYFDLNYIPAPLTIYKNIFKLEPATVIVVKYDSFKKFDIKKDININEQFFKKTKWWDIEEKTKNKISYSSKIDILHNALKKSVKKQTLSDVGVGAFLSGGIDSSLIAFLIKEQKINNLDTYTISVDDKNYDESVRAKRISNLLGFNNHMISVNSKDVIRIMPNINNIYSEPFADSSQVPTYLLSRFVSQQNKVVLTGDGGDEIFSGYIRHIWSKKIFKIINIFPLLLRKKLSKFLFNLNINQVHKFEKILEKFFTNNSKLVQLDKKLIKLGSLLDKLQSTESFYYNLVSIWPNASRKKNIELHTFLEEKNLRLNISDYDIKNYLHDDVLCKVDRASMANSLETRAPFLDYDVFKASRLFSDKELARNSVGKIPLRDILNKYLPEKEKSYPKKGFGLPLNKWLREELKEWVSDIFNSEKSKNQEFLDIELVKKYWDLHLKYDQNYGEFIWNSIIFLDWLKNE